MSELTVRVRREIRADGAKVLTIAFCNETQETLTNVPCGVKITDKKDIVYKDFNEVIDSLSPDEYYWTCNKVCVNGHSMLTCKEGWIWPKENRKRKMQSIYC